MTVAQIKNRINISFRQGKTQFYPEDLGNGTILKMVAIPQGSFIMGSPETEPDRRTSEFPQHSVTLQSFFMGMFPVTQAQWRAVATQLPQINIKLNPEPSRFQGDENRPVEQVSWFEAVEFCDRLSVKTGREYRLPTEAEWEYACRAGTTTPFHFGETISTDLANYRGTDDEDFKWSGSWRGSKGIYRQETTATTYFKTANAFGLFDMHGNVLEWCLDTWHDSYSEKPEELKKSGNIPWVSGDESKENRLLRGGSWLYDPRNCRSAYRFYFHPGGRGSNVGFRIVSCLARTLP
ncbi:formylglycine-generating enzyme family protein [Pseudanabaena sp. FACHB-1277]|uniref:Formylglycine-generating enzyme family protein n=1 Tax=Pseudanabaena cinerea FACHB-1277 TaxID=2949581 RepID=A0A926UU45_9CYAN|nr:formylglycine-generating enzyme family protein [Pseudanabaena cinerea]MBD2151142.1 formylglycine-generating enzyme family protein [Pseudanabaena cinerea FACHB-1277]